MKRLRKTWAVFATALLFLATLVTTWGGGHGQYCQR